MWKSAIFQKFIFMKEGFVLLLALCTFGLDKRLSTYSIPSISEMVSNEYTPVTDVEEVLSNKNH